VLLKPTFYRTIPKNLLNFAKQNNEAVFIVEVRVSDESVVIYAPSGYHGQCLNNGEGGGLLEAVEAVTTNK
jgi:hypothetical protein